MHTRSVDVAAYLHLNGIDPNEVRFDSAFKVREFRYRARPEVAAAMRAFDNGAMVPAKAFCEARATMKALRIHSSGRHVHNLRHALERASDQAQQEEP